jgi:pullulanase
LPARDGFQKLSRQFTIGWLACAALSCAHAATADDGLAACNQPSHQTVLRAAAADATPAKAEAVWVDAAHIAWPVAGAANTSTNRFRLVMSSTGALRVRVGEAVEGADESFSLTIATRPLPDAKIKRVRYLGDSKILALTPNAPRADALRRAFAKQMVLVEEDAQGHVVRATYTQHAYALDALYEKDASVALGGVVGVAAKNSSARLSLNLWAPTAIKVAACVYADATQPAARALPMTRRDAASSGVWRTTVDSIAPLHRVHYTYLVDVFVRGVGLVRNRVTDPYSVSLNTNSARSVFLNLDAAEAQPAAWKEFGALSRAFARRVAAQTDISIYELHVRDFSINDASVSAANRGKYLAFTEAGSNGMRHLAGLAKAGLTDIHFLPVFDIATIPEAGCVTPEVSGAPDGDAQQKIIAASADKDCFNWGYDPFHFNAPEGSYASDAGDGLKRVLEIRAMVAALARLGLRTGMDVVYNHTSASGQSEKSVLDRAVPGYYQRFNKEGKVEQSTCCENTATEHRMMAKLMSDSALHWAQHYGIRSFRFDLMGHQPRTEMEAMYTRLKRALGTEIQFIGEGWNFGEIENGKRFVQASQLSLNGSGIGTFNDRLRDAVRGGAYNDEKEGLIKTQGFINGLVYAPNALADRSRPREDLLRAADMVRVGLAGSIRDFSLTTYRGENQRLEQIDYNGQPAGYVTEPREVVNYVENHDNQTLFDINVYKLPLATTRDDRARVQMLGAAVVAFAQGVAYFHAGIDTLRSKSLEGNSFDSGDWFNRIDWTYRDNYFGTGLPLARDNSGNYDVMRPLLANADIKPTSKEIGFARDQFRDLLAIRASSTLLRLRTAEDIKRRLTFHNVGVAQTGTLIAAHIDGAGYAGANFNELVYFINVATEAQSVRIDALKGRNLVLHPVHAANEAADKRVAAEARYDATGQFTIPARSAVVFVRR